MVAAKEVGIVIVANIARLSRQLLDFELFRLLAVANNTLLYADGRFVDPADSNDIVYSQLQAMFASHENRQRVRLMSQARITKAKNGAVVSSLPVGWVKGPDGTYEKDPETKDTIQFVIETFWEKRSPRGTVKALAKAGVQIPCRRGKSLLHKTETGSREENPHKRGVRRHLRLWADTVNARSCSGQWSIKTRQAPRKRVDSNV